MGGDSLELNVLSGTHGPQFVSTLYINIQWLNNKISVRLPVNKDNLLVFCVQLTCMCTSYMNMTCLYQVLINKFNNYMLMFSVETSHVFFDSKASSLLSKLLSNKIPVPKQGLRNTSLR